MKTKAYQDFFYTAFAVASMLTLGWANPVLAQSSGSYNKYEQEALKIVHDWDEAWKTKDAKKIAQYMAEDVVIPDPIVQKESGTGREKFINAYNKNKAMSAINYYEVISRYAAGSDFQTIVMEKRRDHVTMDGKETVLNFVGYFRVQKGKIVEWVDVPIVLPPGAKGPPPSPGPSAAAPPGAPTP